MGWRCVWVRRQLPLFVGEDLTEQEQGCVESHLRVCRPCRNHMESLRRSRQVMLDCRSMSSDGEGVSSVWPTIKVCLADHPRERNTRATWLPTGAMIAACVAIGVIVWNRPAGIQPLAGRDAVRGTLATSTDLEPDWAAGLASPAVQMPSDMVGMPEAFMRPGTHFHLEGAVPVRASAVEF